MYETLAFRHPLMLHNAPPMMNYSQRYAIPWGAGGMSQYKREMIMAILTIYDSSSMCVFSNTNYTYRDFWLYMLKPHGPGAEASSQIRKNRKQDVENLMLEIPGCRVG